METDEVETTISIGRQPASGSSSSLTDNTNVDNLMSRRRSGSNANTSSNSNTKNSVNKTGRKSLSSASSTTSSSSICSGVSLESNTSIRSSNRRRNTIVPGTDLSTQGPTKKLSKQKSSHLDKESLNNEQENTSSSTSSLLSTTSSTSGSFTSLSNTISSDLNNDLTSTKSNIPTLNNNVNKAVKKSTKTVEAIGVIQQQNEKRQSRQTRQTLIQHAPLSAPLAPPPVPPPEPTLTESTNIDKNDAAKKNNVPNKKQRKPLNNNTANNNNSSKRKPDVVNAIVKNENYQSRNKKPQLVLNNDNDNQEVDDGIKSPLIDVITNESSSLSRESATPNTPNITTASFAPLANLDDNTLDGFNFSNRNKNSNQIDENTTTDVEVDIEENTNTQMELEEDNTTTDIEQTKTGDNNSQSNNPTNNESQMDATKKEEGGGNTTEVKIKKTKKRRKSVMVRYMDHLTACSSVAKIFVYKWPQKPKKNEDDDAQDQEEELDTDDEENPDANQYLLQEQISEYLGVKSFKRKYPDIFRRILDIKEREYLKENEIVTETQCDLGLTALRLNDCLDIMRRDYPDKHKEFGDYLQETRLKNLKAAAEASRRRRIEKYMNKPKTVVIEDDNLQKNSTMTASEKMKEMIRKAMKSATSYNAQLQREKKNERASFYDLQTMRIQKPCAALNKTSQKDEVNLCGKPALTTAKPCYYPVSVLQGQFQYYYKRYTSEELKHMPLNTVIYNPPVPEPLLYSSWKRKEMKRRAQTAANKNYDSSDDDEILINEPLSSNGQQPQLNSNYHKERQSLNSHPVRTSINPAYSSLISNQSLSSSSSSNNATFRITASAAPTVAKLVASSSAASSSLSPSTTTVQVSSSSSSVLASSLIISNNNSNKLCSICLNKSANSSNNSSSEPMVCCSACKSFSHPNCLELNPKLVNWQCIRQYAWECMDCKKCSVCSSANDDEKMMFCDRCDRGFHTYCVNVSKVPEGSWLCKTCTECVEKAADDQRIIKNFCTTNQMEEVKIKDGHVILSNIVKSPLSYKQIAVKNESTGVLSTPQSSNTSILHSKIKNRINSNESLSAQAVTGEKRKGRGRPPGSLNKPKDPNSPKKSANKMNKIKKMELNLSNSLNLNHQNGQNMMSTSYGFERDESNMNQSDYNDMEYDDENSLQNSSYLNFTSNIINIPKFEFHTNNSNTNANSFHNYN